MNKRLIIVIMNIVKYSLGLSLLIPVSLFILCRGLYSALKLVYNITLFPDRLQVNVLEFLNIKDALIELWKPIK